ncbi:MAG: Uncharacterized protein XD63_0943 [Thermoanaerobacterales bacterium 50_218]|nr:MAG: Uncharacterized protein XD63_0943 [Thermoanaerobacterales bacterium 50_218]
MSYIEKAKELGYALRECKETLVLQAAEMNLDNDQEAQNLIREFQQQERKLKEKQESGIAITSEEWDQFNQVQEKMKQNKSIQAYLAAQANFYKLLQQVNLIINQVLRGETCSPSACSQCNNPECK